MRRAKWFAIALFVLVASLATGGTASASGAPRGTGTLTCSIGGAISFNPPLTADGSLAGRGQHEVAIVDLSLSHCGTPASTSPTPAPTAASLSGRQTVKLKPTAGLFMGHIYKVLGACSFSDFNPDGTFRSLEYWTGGASVFKTKTTLDLDTVGGSVRGSSLLSYPGIVSGTLNLTAASSSEYNSVCNNEGLGSIPDLQFDSSTSTLTIGEG